jgi:hypothetical protein
MTKAVPHAKWRDRVCKPRMQNEVKNPAVAGRSSYRMHWRRSDRRLTRCRLASSEVMSLTLFVVAAFARELRMFAASTSQSDRGEEG